MGGRGELVSYRRIRATTDAQRRKLKREINDLINQAAVLATAITVISLVEEPTSLRISKTKRSLRISKTKRRKKRKKKRGA
jgi:hypothetical protein